MTLLHMRKVEIEPDAARQIFEIAKRPGPYSAGVNLAEAEWLLIIGEDGKAEAILADLRERASLQSGVWLADAILAARKEDWDRMRESARRCLAVAVEPHLTQCGRLQ